MFVVMGATGNVGSAVADVLLAQGEPVTVLTRRPEGAAALAARGAIVAKADVDDVASLKKAFRTGTRAFLINPPAVPSSDTDATELRTIANILEALQGSGLEKVVAASTYGARPGEAIGDLSTLWEFEEGLRSQPIPAAVNRAAYYMTNWLGFTEAAKDTGILPSMFPADTKMPMVAPADLGRVAAERLLSSVADTDVQYVEGPARYTPQDVADAFAASLGRGVTVEVAPRDAWEAVFRNNGFSSEAAAAYARMTAVSLDSDFDKPPSPRHGMTSLQAFISEAVPTA